MNPNDLSMGGKKGGPSPGGRRSTIRPEEAMQNFKEGQLQKFDVVNQYYNLYLKVYYKCKEGQSIAISGSIDSIGNWKEFTELEWTAGDIWVTRQPIESHVHFFRYKYVIFDKNEKKLISWERGIDRIADLAILEPIDRVPGTNRVVQR